MEADGMPAKLLRLIKGYYRSTRARVRAYSEESEMFEVKTGVHQGCALSPTLFNYTIEYILGKALRDYAGVAVGRNVRVSFFLYVVVVVVVSLSLSLFQIFSFSFAFFLFLELVLSLSLSLSLHLFSPPSYSSTFRHFDPFKPFSLSSILYFFPSLPSLPSLFLDLSFFLHIFYTVHSFSPPLSFVLPFSLFLLYPLFFSFQSSLPTLYISLAFSLLFSFFFSSLTLRQLFFLQFSDVGFLLSTGACRLYSDIVKGQTESFTRKSTQEMWERSKALAAGWRQNLYTFVCMRAKHFHWHNQCNSMFATCNGLFLSGTYIGIAISVMLTGGRSITLGATDKAYFSLG
ncbi:unnamed protein product [Acanthosepion pharaonis]|uniref:Reverse transcriptase domain-containing protein n=1 Tax=Acanthosepion pharaonis TaxID=158019 RepID=A0A812DXJ8_ACAPH|nr:unnamed protein product [Sepia pharaonis]